MKIFIGDSNIKDYQVLKGYIDKWSDNVCVYYRKMLYYQIPKELLECDLIILEIDIERVNGFNYARMLRKQGIEIPIVFQTNNTNYGIESYDLKIKDYFIKPVNEKRFMALLDEIYLLSNKDYLVYNYNKMIKKVILDEIIFIEKTKNCLNIYHLLEVDKCYKSLKDIEVQLDNSFYRIHRGYIVNIKYIREINGFNCILKNNTVIPIARNRLKALKVKLYEINMKQI